MAIETTLSKTWKKRQMLIACFLFAVSLWFFYDGGVQYPKQNVRYDRFKELEQSGRDHEWPKVAGENGWPRKAPHKRFSQVDLAGQFFFGGLGLAAALAAGIWFVISSRQRLSADDQAIRRADGKVVPFDRIGQLDRRKWESKGIVYAVYDEGGREKRLTLDDYKFEGAEAIIRAAEAHLAKRGEGSGVDPAR
jgi:hypothetical protein